MESRMQVREVSLGEQGLRYVRDLLSTGGPLAQVLGGIDLSRGTATTFMPVDRPEPAVDLRYDYGLSRSEWEQIRDAAMSKTTAHFAGSLGHAWALSEDRYEFGLGRFVKDPKRPPETRIRLARIRDRGIYYLDSFVDASDVEDLLEAAAARANISALGAGGPIATHDMNAVDWESEIMPTLPEYVRIIICEAFDELGFVFWGEV